MSLLACMSVRGSASRWPFGAAAVPGISGRWLVQPPAKSHGAPGSLTTGPATAHRPLTTNHCPRIRPRRSPRLLPPAP